MKEFVNHMSIGIIGIMKAVKEMRNRDYNAVMRIWMPEINENKVSSVLNLAAKKGMNPINVSLVHNPTVDEIANSGDKYPEPTPIKLESLKSVDNFMDDDRINIIIFKDYDLAGELVQKTVLDALNNHGFTPGAWPDKTLLFILDKRKKTGRLIIDLPTETMRTE
jgi:hypothetical protein